MKRKGLSLLVFSRNDIESASRMIRDLYDAADEIVVMDCSDAAHSGQAPALEAKMNLRKLRLFRVLALGYPDPMRMYALEKCRYEWVLLLDTDERPSQGLLQDVRKIIAGTTASAFAIKRYENVAGADLGAFSTWQIRLMRNGKVTYRGLRHEQAQVKGRLMRLDGSRYYLEHRKVLTPERDWGYGKIEKVDTRLSYSLYNEKMLDYLSKTMMLEGRDLKSSLSYRLVSSFLSGYEALTLRKPDGEISDFDYFFYYLSLSLGYAIKQKDIRAICGAASAAFSQLKRMRAWKREDPDGEFFEISKEINRIGITRFLALDDEKQAEKLYAANRRKRQGIDLLISLLIWKYRQTHKVNIANHR